MKNRIPLVVLTLMLAFTTGCATTGSTNQYKKPLCAIAGAAIGGAAGNAMHDDESGTAVGVIAGGVIAWLICDDEKARDSDGDGVADSRDDCPGTPRGAEVNSRGCPMDADGDGVPDSQDQCPDTPRGTRVNAQGCALDSDGDGVSDDKDACPSTPSGVAVDSTGCPMDSDGDGVYDNMDQCPGTPSGETVNERGCHTILSLKGVNFQTNSAQLSSQAESELNQVVKMLKDDQSIKLQVEGHTDNTGAESYNQSLSQKRAQAVVDYLAESGIDRNRMTAIGLGEASPIASNDTPAGRSSNRRVDLVDRK